jgi:hypothetical protein
MQNRDDVDGSQRPHTADAPEMKTPATDQDVGGHLGAGGDPVEGGEDAINDELTSSVAEGVSGGVQNTPAKE